MTTTLNQAVDEEVPAGMHSIRELTDNGDDVRIIWDPADADGVAAARAMFDDLTKKGHRAYSVSASGERTASVRTFDESAEKLIFAPALRGG